MPDVVVFKIQDLTEGGFVTYGPEYSQFSENFDLAKKRLVVQVDSWATEKAKELRQPNTQATERKA
jgi:hypothetical protein